MTAAFNQDDQRERAMVSALNLDQRSDRGRQDEDAHLDVNVNGAEVRLLFELKSSAVDSDFGTGRDTGLPQLERWAGMHFVFGWFTPRDNIIKRLWYGSPAMMNPWNSAEQNYLAPDLLLSSLTPNLITESVLHQVLGMKDVYDYFDLRRLMKNHWGAKAGQGLPSRYVEKADVRKSKNASDRLYSPSVALEAVQDRVRYLLERGSTVNNRKISMSYVQDHCVELTGPKWAGSLTQAVEKALPGGT